MAALPVGALLAVAACTTSLAGSAQLMAAEPARTKVLIRVSNADDEALLERVRGQVSDLDWS